MQRRNRRHIINITAGPGDWVRVRRPRPAQSCDWMAPAIQVALYVGGALFVLWLISQVLPYLLGGLVLVAGLKFFARS